MWNDFETAEDDTYFSESLSVPSGLPHLAV